MTFLRPLKGEQVTRIVITPVAVLTESAPQIWTPNINRACHVERNVHVAAHLFLVDPLCQPYLHPYLRPSVIVPKQLQDNIVALVMLSGVFLECW